MLMFVAMLFGCVPAVASKDFAPTQEVLQYPANKKFVGKLARGEVTVKDDVMGAINASNVSDALNLALNDAHYLSPASVAPIYRLDVSVLEIDRPFIALDLNVKATMHYTITRISDGQVVFNEQVTIGHEVPFFSEADANERLRKAIAKAISGNITHFLRLLSISNV
ncbi:MAG: hypothetical protein KDD53_03680 [Bdellovibrionales bacterium]|nr:hypothetical protein [Bdellovibrionales bacterium]